MKCLCAVCILIASFYSMAVEVNAFTLLENETSKIVTKIITVNFENLISNEKQNNMETIEELESVLGDCFLNCNK